jgi:hypothetical protein
MRKIESEIIINAPAASVWDIITDFDSYPRWNSFTPRITLTSGMSAVGAEFDLDCRMTERLLLENEHEVILARDTDTYRLCMGTSRTRGRPGIRSFRWQICEPADSGSTRFVNYEQFQGFLAPLVYFMYANRLKKAFDRYCIDLKRYAESLAESVSGVNIKS